MLRGINQQQIFEDEEDNLRFLETLFKYKQQCGYEIYAYCLMGNHVHILLKEGKEDLTLVLKRIAGSYVYWYNWKYHRSGHLFQDRFKSEPVEDDAYFLTVLRYIHQNPVKANLCAKAEKYPYSSFAEYLYGSDFVDTDFALGMIIRDEFIKFNNAQNSDICLDIGATKRMGVTDGKAKEIIVKVSKCETITEFQSLEENKKERFIKRIYEKGVSIRQLSRLTGTTKGMVERYLKI